MATVKARIHNQVTWLTLLASVLVIFAGRLAPLHKPQPLRQAFISVQALVQTETPAKLETTQQLRVISEISVRPQITFVAILPSAATMPATHPYRFSVAEHPTLYSLLLKLEPRSRSPPLLLV